MNIVHSEKKCVSSTNIPKENLKLSVVSPRILTSLCKEMRQRLYSISSIIVFNMYMICLTIRWSKTI